MTDLSQMIQIMNQWGLEESTQGIGGIYNDYLEVSIDCFYSLHLDGIDLFY